MAFRADGHCSRCLDYTRAGAFVERGLVINSGFLNELLPKTEGLLFARLLGTPNHST